MKSFIVDYILGIFISTLSIAIALFVVRKQTAAVKHAVVTGLMVSLIVFIVLSPLNIRVTPMIELPHSFTQKTNVVTEYFRSKGYTTGPVGRSEAGQVIQITTKESEYLQLYSAFYLTIIKILLIRVSFAFLVSRFWWFRAERTGDRDVRVSRKVKVPMTTLYGILMPPGEVDPAVLLHERAHRARRDPFWQVFSQIVTAFAWLNPVNWILLRLQSQYAEQAADDVVVRSGENARHYAETLLKYARQAHSNFPALGNPIVGQSDLKIRVKKILDNTVKRNPLRKGVFALILACTTVFTAAESVRWYSKSQDIPDEKPNNKKYLGHIAGTKVNNFHGLSVKKKEIVLERLFKMQPDGTAVNWAPDGKPLPDVPDAPYRTINWNYGAVDQTRLVFRVSSKSNRKHISGGIGNLGDLGGEEGNFFGTTSFSGNEVVGSGDQTYIVSLMKFEGTGETYSVGLWFSEQPWQKLLAIDKNTKLPVGEESKYIIESMSEGRNPNESQVKIKHSRAFDYETLMLFSSKSGETRRAYGYNYSNTATTMSLTMKSSMPWKNVSQFSIQYREGHQIGFEKFAIKPLP
jgi:Zn-dependent protease with chaperone function